MTTSKASYDEVETAFLAVNSETVAWLDRVTGEVMIVTEDIRAMLDDGPAELPDWVREEVARIRRVLRAVGDWDNDALGDDEETEATPNAADRYVAIPETPSHEAFQDMEDFVATLPHTHAAAALIQALRGGKPFRRFKDTLYDYPAEQEGWYKFQNQRLRERITNWAQDEGITLG
jgi:hypothetical protein